MRPHNVRVWRKAGRRRYKHGSHVAQPAPAILAAIGRARQAAVHAAAGGGDPLDWCLTAAAERLVQA